MLSEWGVPLPLVAPFSNIARSVYINVVDLLRASFCLLVVLLFAFIVALLVVLHAVLLVRNIVI